MGSLDPAKLLVILVVALIVLGPERLPRVARQLGAAWRELTRVRDKVTDEVRSAMPDLDLPKIPRASSAISSFLSDLTRPVPGATDPEERDKVAEQHGVVPTIASNRQRRSQPDQDHLSVDSSDPSMN